MLATARCGPRTEVNSPKFQMDRNCALLNSIKLRTLPMYRPTPSIRPPAAGLGRDLIDWTDVRGHWATARARPRPRAPSRRSGSKRSPEPIFPRLT